MVQAKMKRSAFARYGQLVTGSAGTGPSRDIERACRSVSPLAF
jgi:hypothetical protein